MAIIAILPMPQFDRRLKDGDKNRAIFWIIKLDKKRERTDKDIGPKTFHIRIIPEGVIFY